MAPRYRVVLGMKLTLSTLIAIAVLAVLWWTVGQGEQLPSIARDNKESVIKVYVSGFSQWSFDSDGSPNDEVRIAQLHQHTQDPRIYFSDILATQSDTNRVPLQLTANKGEYRPNAREFWLHNGVKIEQKNDSKNLLETPQLRILRKENRAVNDAPVKLTLDQSTTTGRGLTVDLESRVAEILSNVETIYDK